MKIIRYPDRNDWPEIIKRPNSPVSSIDGTVRRVIDAIRRDGDRAVRRSGIEFDGVEIDELLVSESEFSDARLAVSDELADAISLAHANIKKFHSAENGSATTIETSPGVYCWRRSVPIERVGLYVPAGTASLFSTLLMLGVPAKLAGCRDIVICTPPGLDGAVAPAILYAAEACGIGSVFKVGGVQAIAAMAYGTETIPKVDKIFGPGNSFVTTAKQIVSMDVAIDLPAGPSEVAVLADRSCEPPFVAADLLSQAEHGPDSGVILVANCEAVIERTLAEVGAQVQQLPRREIAEAALSNASAVLVRDLDDGIDLLNQYAPEHLILAVDAPHEWAEKVINAGSVFLGKFSCESAGDYASGPNHTLPTAGFARAYSGVSVDSFLKKITFQYVTESGIREIGPAVEVMAAAEGLYAHKRAMSIRREALDGI